MSHFSKIKTSITDLDILKKTIDDLGFFYQVSPEDLSSSNHRTVFVYDSHLCFNQVPSCSFEWNLNEYLLVVDLGLWNLDIDFNYFTERLLQQYAYNVVIRQGSIQGFIPVVQELADNGSINLILQRF